VNTDDPLVELWRYLDEQQGQASTAALVDRWLHEQIESPGGQGLTPELLYTLSMRRRIWRDGQFLTPKPLADFIARVAELYTADSILDPVCGSGLLLHAVATSVQAEVVHGIDLNADAVRRSQALLGDIATILQGDALSPPPGILDDYDLIVADPPLGMRLKKPQFVPGLGLYNGELGHALTVWACERLRDHGAALVIVTPPFLWGSHSGKIQEAIAELGCFVRALIHLPGGSLHWTGIDSYLALLERGEQGDVFVGQFSDDAAQQKQLVANIKRRKPGPQPALGRLCPLPDFKGFESLAARERLKRLARTAGWKGLPAADVITAYRILGQSQSDPLEHGPTSCYLRLSGRPLAVLDVDDLPGSSAPHDREVLHLHLASEHADPRYMVHWFNASQIGQATLSVVRRGTSQRRIHLADLLEVKLYLPPVTEQMKAVKGAAHLTRIRAVADELEAVLWDGTGDLATIVNDIATINQEDRFEDWIESLPFPLASILWRHHAGGASVRERYEVLLHFFEATAAFLATVHLSAFMASNDLWEEHGSQLSRQLTSQHLSLDRATFGAWKLVTEYLSSICGSLLKNPDRAELWRRIYATPNENVLAMLSNPELRSLLQRSNRIRNDWSGHAGAIGPEKAMKIHGELMELVHSLRGVFGRIWLSYELIQPGESQYKGGIHHYRAKRLMGTRSAPFEEVQLESTQLLETDVLHLFDTTSQTGLRLQPFVRVMPSPEKRANACFIFNRREDGAFRYVSYHFEAESEIAGTFPDVERALGRIHQFDEESSI
jgi:hypothetical protein